MGNYIKEINQILEKTGWTQAQFAQELGVTFATVNRWLNKHTKPHTAQLKQIQRLYRNIVGIVPLPQAQIEAILKLAEAKKKRHHNITKFLQQEKVEEALLLELTHNSDAIEGSTLTKKETEAIIFDNATIKDKSLNEHLEAVNHASILKDIFSGKISTPITEDEIKNMHKNLMHGIRDDAGEYSKHERGIRGVDLALPHPKDIQEEMERLLKKINSFKGHPIGHVAQMHADFEAIHPFGDGNGRIGRLIMIIQLINQGFAPCVIMQNDKARYYECLEFAQKKSESHLVYFLAQAVLKGYEIIEKSF